MTGENMDQIPAVWMRGGTSKCWVFLEEDLRHPTLTVDEVLLRLFGSPDSRQVDGVGGGTSTTSKAVILRRSNDRASMSTTPSRRSASTNPGWTGEATAATARPWSPRTRSPRLGPAVEPLTTVRVLNTNTQQMIIQQVAVREGAVDESPVQHIPGVPFKGPAVRMGFLSPAGRTTGQLLPTGSATDQLDDGGSSVEATLIDAGAPLVILRATDLGLTGARPPPPSMPGPTCWPAWTSCAARARWPWAWHRPRMPRPEPSPSWPSSRPRTGRRGPDLVRMLSMGLTHPAIAITGSIGITIAASTPGTIVHDLASPRRVRDEFDISTPAGVVTTWSGEHDGESVVGAVRSYRRLAQATLPLPARADH